MNPRPLSRRLAVSAVAVAVSLAATTLLSGCGDDDDTASTDTTQTTAATESTDAAAPADGIEVAAAWARTSPAMTTRGAIYMELTNGTDADDALIGASVDASIAGTVELHETTSDGGEGMEGEDSGDGMEAPDSTEEGTGMMSMSPVEEIAVPAGETVVLEPGGFHIMLLDLVEPLELGTTVEVTLTFAEAGEVVVTADVLDAAP